MIQQLNPATIESACESNYMFACTTFVFWLLFAMLEVYVEHIRLLSDLNADMLCCINLCTVLNSVLFEL